MQYYYNELKRQNVDFQFFLYDDAQSRQFIDKNMDAEILYTFDKLIPVQYRASLFAFCALYIFGGIYLDLKYIPVNGFTLGRFVEDTPVSLDKDNGCIVASPKSDAVYACIQTLVQCVKYSDYTECIAAVLQIKPVVRRSNTTCFITYDQCDKEDTRAPPLFSKKHIYKYPVLHHASTHVASEETIVRTIEGRPMTFHASNASLVLLDDKTYLMNRRWINYTYKDDGSKIITEKQWISFNSRVYLDTHLQPVGEETFYKNDFEKRSKLPGPAYGIEDVRLFFHGKTLYYNASFYDPSTQMTCTTCAPYPSSTTHDIQIQKIVPPHPQLREKNWCYIPSSSDPLRMVYSWYPLKICRVQRSNLIEEREIVMPDMFRDAKGSTPGTLYKDEIWFVVHKSHKYVEGLTEYYSYQHFFAVFNTDMQLLRYSELFSFAGAQVEYCLSLLIEEDRVIIPYTLLDTVCKIGVYSRATIEGTLRWYKEKESKKVWDKPGIHTHVIQKPRPAVLAHVFETVKQQLLVNPLLHVNPVKQQTPVKPVANPVINPLVKPVIKPLIKHVINPVAKPVAKPLIKPVKPVIKPVIKPVAKPVVNQVQMLLNTPSNTKAPTETLQYSNTHLYNPSYVQNVSMKMFMSKTLPANTLPVTPKNAPKTIKPIPSVEPPIEDTYVFPKYNLLDPIITIVSPECINTIANILCTLFESIGWKCNVIPDSDTDKYNTHFKEYPNHYFFFYCLFLIDKKTVLKKNKYILFQLEQNVNDWSVHYKSILEHTIHFLENAKQLFDYSTINIEFFKSKGFVMQYMPIPYLPSIHNTPCEKTIDILFVGCMNDRRQRILERVKTVFPSMAILTNTHGDELIHYIRTSKILLNIHYYENAILERVRLNEVLAVPGIMVVSEKPNPADMDICPFYKDLVSFVDMIEGDNYDELIYQLSKSLAVSYNTYATEQAIHNLKQTTDKDIDTCLQKWLKPDLLTIRPKDIAIVSANYGGYDASPSNLTTLYNIGAVDWYYFTDNHTVEDPVWNIIHTKEAPCNSMAAHNRDLNRLYSKYYKIQAAHHNPLLEKYKYVVWMDASVLIENKYFVRDICNLIQENREKDLFIFEHYFRDNIREELNASLLLKSDKYKYQDIRKQVDTYLKDEAFAKQKYMLSETGFFILKKSETTKRCMDDWWTENIKYSFQCQLSLPYVVYKNQVAVYRLNEPNFVKHAKPGSVWKNKLFGHVRTHVPEGY